MLCFLGLLSGGCLALNPMRRSSLTGEGAERF
jgi:hypothetical protein